MRRNWLLSKKERCPECKLNQNNCICTLIKGIDIRTRITIVMHASELEKTTNTARLIEMAIPSAEVIVVGKKGETPDLSTISGSELIPYLLFPESSARPIDHSFALEHSNPIHLVVPDGTWAQARQMIHRRPELMSMKRVKIEHNSPSRYTLRRQRDSSGLCTAEAIAYAVGALESEFAQHHILNALDILVGRILDGRGRRPTTTHQETSN